MGDSFVAARDIVRDVAVRALVVVRPAVVRRTGVAARDFVPVRAVVVRGAIDVPPVRVCIFVRGATVVVAVRDEMFLAVVAVRGSTVVVARSRDVVVAPIRPVVVDLFDCVTPAVPRAGVDVETFGAVARDAARAISS